MTTLAVSLDYWNYFLFVKNFYACHKVFICKDVCLFNSEAYFLTIILVITYLTGQ